MTRGRLYPFEGTEATIAQIRACVPCLSYMNIRQHLEAGRTTRQAMLTFDTAAARRRGGKKGRAAAGFG